MTNIISNKKSILGVVVIILLFFVISDWQNIKRSISNKFYSLTSSKYELEGTGQIQSIEDGQESVVFYKFHFPKFTSMKFLPGNGSHLDNLIPPKAIKVNSFEVIYIDSKKGYSANFSTYLKPSELLSFYKNLGGYSVENSLLNINSGFVELSGANSETRISFSIENNDPLFKVFILSVSNE
jgi:hypothetical protein